MRAAIILAGLSLPVHAESSGPTVPSATPGPTSEAVDVPVLTADEIEQRAKEAQDSETLDEAAKTELLKRYQAALERIAASHEARAKAAAYEAEVQQAPSSERLKDELARPLPDPDIQVPQDVSLIQLEQMTSESETKLESAQQILADREDDLNRRADRKGELVRLVEETKRKVEEAKQQVSAEPPGDETPEMTAARRIEWEARAMALNSQLLLYKAERKRLDALTELFPLQRDLAKREKSFREKELTAYQQLVSQHRKIESQRQADEAQRQVELAQPALRDLAEHNAALAEKRKAVSASISQLTRELKRIDKRRESLKTDFAKATNKVQKAGHSTTVGLLLRKQRDELPSVESCQRRIHFVELEMPKINLDRINLEDHREELADMEVAVANVTARLPKSDSHASAAALDKTARRLLQTKRDLLDRLHDDYDTYLSELSELELGNRALILDTRQFINFIDQHVLWIRSTDQLTASDAKTAAAGLLLLAKPVEWIGLAKTSGIDTFQRPIPAMSVLLGAALLILLQSRLHSRIRLLCAPKKKSTRSRFLPTVESLVLAAVASVEWPLLAYYFGSRMTSAQQTSALGLALGPALQYGACLLWFSGFARHICQTGGIAESHFLWPAASLKVARRKLWSLTILGVPLAMIVVWAQIYQKGQWANSLGRMAFLGVMLVLATFFHRLLGRKENVLREAISRNTSPWLGQVRPVVHLIGVAGPIFLAILAAIGFYYSAQQLAIKMHITVGWIAGLVLLHAVATRWFLVKRRNLNIQQVRARRQRVAEIASESPDDALPSAIPRDDPHPDLSVIHEKTLLLLRHAVTVCVLVGSWFIWCDELPALKAFDRIVLWEKTVEVAETIEDSSGNLVRQQVLQDVPTTLRHVIIAGLLLLATFLLGKNLPALLEFTVLSRLPLDTGARHAVSVILNYTVAFAGFLLACRTLHITWSSVQWLAAGMTVGLGFGLQEVFANFVSGLILLFERPIRVGDVITLGDITGAVTNIQIRATTVRSWDRKELIVPNKELITGRLLNWTLSDTTNRIVIPIGVAYQSDPEQTRSILFDVIRKHPNVLENPAPNVTFEGFGDSALDFVIRAFVASMDIRLETVHQLHSTIHRRLRDAEIEIAFPQRDINVRQLPMAMPLAPNDVAQHSGKAA